MRSLWAFPLMLLWHLRASGCFLFSLFLHHRNSPISVAPSIHRPIHFSLGSSHRSFFAQWSILPPELLRALVTTHLQQPDILAFMCTCKTLLREVPAFLATLQLYRRPPKEGEAELYVPAALGRRLARLPQLETLEVHCLQGLEEDGAYRPLFLP